MLIAFDGHRWHIRRVLCITPDGTSGEVRYDTKPIRGMTAGCDSAEEALSKVSRRLAPSGRRKGRRGR